MEHKTKTRMDRINHEMVLWSVALITSYNIDKIAKDLNFKSNCINV